jgi:hypothetical protein
MCLTCRALQAVCEQTGTKPEDWEEIDGAPTGVGVEHWFVCDGRNLEAYTCDDQGHITVEVYDRDE